MEFENMQSVQLDTLRLIYVGVVENIITSAVGVDGDIREHLRIWRFATCRIPKFGIEHQLLVEAIDRKILELESPDGPAC